MPRSFGPEISGNRGAHNELSSKTRALIITAWEGGGKPAQLAREYQVNRSSLQLYRPSQLISKPALSTSGS
jgi:hypothetical protein